MPSAGGPFIGHVAQTFQMNTCRAFARDFRHRFMLLLIASETLIDFEHRMSEPGGD